MTLPGCWKNGNCESDSEIDEDVEAHNEGSPAWAVKLRETLGVKWDQSAVGLCACRGGLGPGVAFGLQDIVILVNTEERNFLVESCMESSANAAKALVTHNHRTACL